MATNNGSGSDDLSHLEQLAQNPQKYHIFQALRIIEAAHPDAPLLGESRRPREDRVRLRQEAELAFPPSTIARFAKGKDGGPDLLTNRFFGLFGPQGPLPLHLTEYARDRQRNHRDSTFVAFANMLTHRLLGLLYRAWMAGQPAVAFDRNDDSIARKVAALCGNHADNLRGRDSMPDLTKLHFAGHMGQGPKNAEGLISILSDFFDVPVDIEQFVGCWLQLESDDRWELGAPSGLGQTTSLGNQVWSRAIKFRIIIGPVSLAQYERLLPGGPSLDRLRAIVRNYVGDALDWDLNLILAGDEVPRVSLGGSTRLGQTSWTDSPSDSDEPRADASDLYLYPGPGMNVVMEQAPQ